jgi:hypothetical protein
MKPAAFLLTIALLASGCATTYIPPGEKADLQVFSSPDIAAGFAAAPSNPWPAGIAVVRLQSPGYTNYYLRQRGGSYGHGRYSVVLTRELGEEELLKRVAALDEVAGLVSLNRMLLPERLQSDEDLRAAAARVQADLVFLYTFDTSFFERNVSRPMTAISLGLSATQHITAMTTCSAVLMDTRTGYIYSVYETTERTETRGNIWTSQESADKARQDNERMAFEKLIDELVKTWPQVLERHGSRASRATSSAQSEMLIRRLVAVQNLARTGTDHNPDAHLN